MDEIKINVFVEPHYPAQRNFIKSIVQKTLEFTESKGKNELSVAIIGDRKMRALNKEYRGLDKTTNVLSFSYIEGQGPNALFESGFVYLGDIYISYPELLKDAAEQNNLVDKQLAILVVHGVLHLLGYDHEKGYDAEKEMTKLEEAILKSLLV